MLLILLLILTSLSILILMLGSIWMLATRGESSQDRGEEVGAQIMDDQIGDDESPVIQKTAFKGKATSYRREASISFAEIKAQLAAGHFSEVLPMILVAGGILGLLTFGSLALFVAMENKLIGGVIAVMAIFTAVRIGVRMVKA